MKIFGLHIIRNKEQSFRKLVAKECYGLTHELVVNKLYTGRMDSRFTGATDAAWLELDRQMKLFTEGI